MTDQKHEAGGTAETTQTFSKRDLITNAARVLTVASNTGRAVVLGDDGQPDIIVSVLKQSLVSGEGE